MQLNEDEKRELISEGLELVNRANSILKSVFEKAEEASNG